MHPSCIVGTSRAASRRTFYTGRAPSKVTAPIVRPLGPFNEPPSWQDIDAQEGRKVPRNVKHPLTSDSYAPDRLFDPELGNRAAVPSPFARKLWLEEGDAQHLKAPDGRGPFWLRKECPFPLNTSFVPPRPIPDHLRERIFEDYKILLTEAEIDEASTDAEGGAETSENQGAGDARRSADPPETTRPVHAQPLLTMRDELILRKLTERYHLSFDRLRAIVRLKAFEERRYRAGKAPQRHFQSEMERIMGAPTLETTDEVVQTIDRATYDASERIRKATAPIVELLDSEGGERSLVDLLRPAPTNERRRRSFAREMTIPLRRRGVVLSYLDTTDTPRGRAWERSNTGRSSRSSHAQRAADLTKLALLGRLPRELYKGKDAEHMRPPPEAPAQWY